MHTYRAVIMSLNETQNKTRFSKEVIDDILLKQPTVPVRINFVGDPIGSASKYWQNQNDVVECELLLRQENLDQLNLFVVPSGVVLSHEIHQDENGITVINRMDLTELSLTSFPADTSLTKLERG